MTELDLWDEQELSRQLLGTSVATIKSWRSRGGGPPFVRLNKRVVYRRESVLRWLMDREQVVEKKAG